MFRVLTFETCWKISGPNVPSHQSMQPPVWKHESHVWYSQRKFSLHSFWLIKIHIWFEHDLPVYCFPSPDGAGESVRDRLTEKQPKIHPSVTRHCTVFQPPLDGSTCNIMWSGDFVFKWPTDKNRAEELCLKVGNDKDVQPHLLVPHGRKDFYPVWLWKVLQMQNHKCQPHGVLWRKRQQKSVGFILWEQWLYVQNFEAIHPIVVSLQQCSTSSRNPRKIIWAIEINIYYITFYV